MKGIIAFLEKSLYTPLALVFLPIKGAILTIVFLCVLDMILGMWAAKKEGFIITSRSMRRTVPKLMVFVSTVCILYLVDTYLMGDLQIMGYNIDPCSKIATALIGAIEAKSVFENMYRITKVDFLRIIITRLQMVHDKLAPANEKDKLHTHTGRNKNEESEEN